MTPTMVIFKSSRKAYKEGIDVVVEDEIDPRDFSDQKLTFQRVFTCPNKSRAFCKIFKESFVKTHELHEFVLVTRIGLHFVDFICDQIYTFELKPKSHYTHFDVLGFISIDCGAPAGVNYTESSTGIIYISDANFINTGESKSVVSELKSTYQQQMWTLRSFPVGKRNCFKVNITRGSRYLIRTNFLYGNYDGLNKLPDFDLHLGPNRWDTVTIQNASTDVYYEIIHVPSLDYIQLCLADTGNGTPFISSIEIRTLKNDTYVAQFGSALQLYGRCDLGANTTVGAYRYKYDVYDRFWETCDSKQNWTSVQNASIATASFGRNHYQLPAIVMSTAVTPTNASAPLVISWKPQHENDQFHAYLHFTEIQVLAANQTRQFNITVGESRHENFSPQYHNVSTAYTRLPIRGKEINFTLEMIKNSTLPPIINAIEVYKVIDLQQLNTFQEDGT
ncbi:hypothetical protein Fmac_019901 [Flemingia macrophylla]|uniref:Malectin-like domain-containing protein n=1 Tax=Flemingia macrophylla TaxID=520843 RepID=A0ABD1M963_9FABA